MKSSPFHVKLIFGLIFALFKTDSSSLKINVELCSKGCKVNNSVCDNTGQCICKSGWYGDKCNYTNDCKLYQNDLNYNGNISVVKNGFQCLFWNNGTHKQFPMMQHNYCRTPSGDPEVIPWCFTQYIKTINRYWDHCDIPVCVCEPGKFGENCENICHCKTPGCDVTNGICNVLGCEDGWSGNRCDKCEGDRFGNNCEQICHCKTPGCNDMTGRCAYSRCSEGWTGDSCSVCMSNRFGPECKIHCHCEVGGCDNMTGVCYEPGCSTGWTGASCNYICMSNRFGPDCKIHCHCELGGCDNMTGVCYEPGCATG
ncbi:uncharacterized protein LOC143052105 [Mytilus galloprovincialis]|uniref:uncharacterized protein LOC143052105 n=1 Tax=Mytilus galloprovincialis TaxID=29158 RepID=UPI003F7B6813